MVINFNYTEPVSNINYYQKHFSLTDVWTKLFHYHSNSENKLNMLRMILISGLLSLSVFLVPRTPFTLNTLCIFQKAIEFWIGRLLSIFQIALVTDKHIISCHLGLWLWLLWWWPWPVLFCNQICPSCWCLTRWCSGCCYCWCCKQKWKIIIKNLSSVLLEFVI